MSQDNVIAFNKPETIEDPLTDLLRTGAKQLIQQAIEAELSELMATYAGATDAEGRAAVVRNGYLPEREVMTGVRPVSVNLPKAGSRGEEPMVFRSLLVPPYVRRAKTLDAALPWLYLKGISTGQMSEALEVLGGLDAKGALHEIWMAPTREDVQRAFDHFITTYEPKYPKAVHCLKKDREALLAFYDLPAEHWTHLRTTNPIESTFGTIRHRTDRAKGWVTRKTMLAMTHKLGQCTEKRWRHIRGFNYLTKLIERVQFKDGIELNKDADSRNAA